MNRLKLCWRKMQHFGIHISDWVAGAVGTWRFVFLYTGSMFLWIWLHRQSYLHIDSEDFIKFNLWLSYFAGTQASIVLMSTTRQTDIDRRKHDAAFQIDQESLLLAREHQLKIVGLMHQIGELEDVIEEMLQEKERSVK
jgi:uncharacterized membrane protein